MLANNPFRSGLFFSVSTFVIWNSKAQFTSSRNLYPPAYPLAVRSPYLNAWIPSVRDKIVFGGTWPYHWDDTNVMGMGGYARVDGAPYRWIAQNSLGNQTTLISTEITPTRSKFTILAGAVQLNVTFLSPIEPSDWVLQSLPFIYVSVDVTSTDGSPHNVQVYLDTTAEWLSSDRSNRVQWKTVDSDGIVLHEATLSSQSSMAERYNIAEDSTVYFGMVSESASSWQTGADSDVRSQFLLEGTLNKTQDTDFRAINDRFVAFAHAVDFGNIMASSAPAVWSLGLVRDPVIMYSVGDARNRSPYFRTQFGQVEDAAKFFIGGYGDAVKRADAIDAKIMTDASAVSSHYADLIAIGTRQTMAGIDITVAYGADGKWNMSDVKAFMKDTGTSQSINPVEGLFSAFPAFLYLNSSLGGLLLDPLLEFQWFSDDHLFSAPDLGLYPQATGHQANASNTALESTGSMLIMALAHAQVSGDGTLLARYYELLKGWTDYLSASSLHTENQLFISSGLEMSDQSNLAIKGIIGIAAMAKISKALNQETDSQIYSAKASDLSAQWTNFAASGGHVTSVYGQPQSRPLVYNLYADLLLRTNIVNSSIYSQQTEFYEVLSAIAPTFGIPYDDSTQETQDVASAPWTIFTAATATQNTTRYKLIDMVHSKATSNNTRGDFPTTYRGSNGEAHLNDGQASPAQGGMFAILALSLPVQNIVAPSITLRDVPKLNDGLIAALVLASLLLSVIGLLIIMYFYLRRRRRKNRLHQEALKPTVFNLNPLDHQRAPETMEMSPIHPDQPRLTSQGIPSNDTRSDYAARGSEPPELSDVTVPHTQPPSESISTSYWSSKLPYLARRAPSNSDSSVPYSEGPSQNLRTFLILE